MHRDGRTKSNSSGRGQQRRGTAFQAGRSIEISRPIGHDACVVGESRNVATARAYLEAGFRGDNEAVAALLGDGFVWIDRAQGIVARTVDELLAAAEEDQTAWSDRVLDVERVTEGVDGTVFVQGQVTQTHTGTWRGVEPTGRRVTFVFCDIFSFDPRGRVVSEDAYQDHLSVMQQLGVIEQGFSKQ